MWLVVIDLSESKTEIFLERGLVVERDGLGFPIVYEGDAAQESLEDPQLQM